MTTKDANMLGADDEEHLNFALRKQRVIFTQDEDFLKLHAKGVTHRGIIFAHQRRPIGQVIQGIMLIHQVLDSTEMKNHVEFL